MRRRAFLACAAAGLAGCGSGDPAGDGTPSPTGGDVGTVGRETGTPTPGTPTQGSGGASPSETAATPTPIPSPTPTATSSPTATPTPTLTPPPALEGYETTRVRLTTPDGERLGGVRAAIADTPDLRYTGLSNVENLPATWGMLFVYESVGDHTYVMRDMDFGIDIVYADDEGVITRIHHAPEPGPDEDGSQQRYPGRGQYVLEVEYEWTAERGIKTGDLIRFDR